MRCDDCSNTDALRYEDDDGEAFFLCYDCAIYHGIIDPTEGLTNADQLELDLSDVCTTAADYMRADEGS